MLYRDVEACRSMIEAAIAGLDDAQAAIRLNGRWSIAEIVEHLDRTYTGTSKGLLRCLEAGSTRVSAPTPRGRVRRFVVITLGWFPSGIEAPRHVVPSGAVPLSAVAAGVRQHLTEMAEVLARTAERFGRQAVLDHPILGPFSVADWARFHVVHTRHHCAQIRDRRRQGERGN